MNNNPFDNSNNENSVQDVDATIRVNSPVQTEEPNVPSIEPDATMSIETPVSPETPVFSESPVSPEPIEAPAKKKSKLPIFIALAAVAVVAIVAAIIVYLTVLKPNGIYDDAKKALDDKDYDKCIELTKQIPDHKDVNALVKDMNDEICKDAKKAYDKNDMDEYNRLLALISDEKVKKDLIQDIENNVYKDAQKALENGDLEKCASLLDRIPDHKNTPELRNGIKFAEAKNYVDNGFYDEAEKILVTILNYDGVSDLMNDITYKRAIDAVAAENYTEAQNYLDKIPDYDDTEGLGNKIKYNNAFAAVEIGDYVTAYALFSELGDYEDSAEQKEMVYYEAWAFSLILTELQPALKDPSSLKLTTVSFYEYEMDSGFIELRLVVEESAANSYGGNVSGYFYGTLIDEDNDPLHFVMNGSDYNDPSTELELLQKYVILFTESSGTKVGNVDVSRMNRLMQNNASFKYDLDFGDTNENEI